MDQAPIPNEKSPVPAETKAVPPPKRSYPGTYDNMFMDVKTVLMIDIMDGFRAEIMKQVTPFFSINHALMLGSRYFPKEMGNSFYNLSFDVYRNNKAINATIDSGSRISGRVVWPITKEWNLLLNAMTSKMPGQDSFSAEIHRKGPDYHITAKCSSGSVFTATYAQYINKNLVMGMDVTRNPLRPGLIYSLSGKYTWGINMIGCTLNSMKQMEAYYASNPSKRTKLVSKLTVDFNNRMSEMQVGALFMFKSGRMHMSLTSSGHLQTLIEEFISPALSMSISVDHSVFQNATHVGFGTKVMMG